MEPARRKRWRGVALRLFTSFTVVIGILVDTAVEAAELQRVSCDYVCKVKKKLPRPASSSSIQLDAVHERSSRDSITIGNIKVALGAAVTALVIFYIYIHTYY